MAMASGKRGIVLSDELFKQYYDFKSKQNFDEKKVKAMLHYFKDKLYTNLRQYELHGIEPDNKSLKNQLAHSSNKKKSVEDLAKETIYKIVLTTDRDTFPYVNVLSGKDKIENCLYGGYDNGENRTKAIEHIKAVCEDARKIVVYDNYFDQVPDNVNTLIGLLPRHRLDLHCYKITTAQEARLKSAYADWNVIRETRDEKKHDRYLVVDDNVEILLSSGFDHLGSIDKDFAYVVRPVNQSRFMY